MTAAERASGLAAAARTRREGLLLSFAVLDQTGAIAMAARRPAMRFRRGVRSGM